MLSIWVILALFETPTTAVVLEDIHIFEFTFDTQEKCLEFVSDNYKGLNNYIKEEYNTSALSFVCIDSKRIFGVDMNDYNSFVIEMYNKNTKERVALGIKPYKSLEDYTEKNKSFLEKQFIKEVKDEKK